MNDLEILLNTALGHRIQKLDSKHTGAIRLFNGFFEGNPDFCIDLFGKTILINHYQKTPNPDLAAYITKWTQQILPFVDCVVLKERYANTPQGKQGTIHFGTEPCQQIAENGVWYKVDLTMNHDASFYLDTRNLREWLKRYSTGKTILNAFAYTGSLGIAALAGGASHVTQLDKSAKFLNLAKESITLNTIEPSRMKIKVDDFFPAISHYKKAGASYDFVLLDPPFFSTTSSGRVDLNSGFVNLINKVRPLIKHNGKLICINNALFVSGAEVMKAIELIFGDGYVSFDQILDVDQSYIGYGEKPSKLLPVDPTPFNHSTKILILNITKKAQ